MASKILTICQLLCFYIVFSKCNSNLEQFYRWKQIEYEGIPDEKEVDESFIYKNLTFPLYDKYNNVLKSVSYYKGRFFITLPRRGAGIPSTVNYIPADLPVGSSPALRPYPDFETNELHPKLTPDENRIISVYRTRVDKCGRMWFIDTATLQDHEGGYTKLLQRPSLWIMDLNTDKKIRRFVIPETIVKEGHGMTSLIIDVEDNKCDEAFAYIPDYLKQKVYTYSFKKNRMWSFSHVYFNNDKKAGNYDIDGHKFVWFDGVFSLTMARRNAEGFRKVFFHSLSGFDEFETNTKILRNEKLSKKPESYLSDFVKIGTRGKRGQCLQHGFDDKTSAVFFGLMSRNALTCWNSNKKYTLENQGVIIENDDRFKYPVDLKVEKDGTLYVLTNNFVRFSYDKLDVEEYNYVLWRGNTKKLVKGTVCESQKFASVDKVEDGGPK